MSNDSFNFSFFLTRQGPRPLLNASLASSSQVCAPPLVTVRFLGFFVVRSFKFRLEVVDDILRISQRASLLWQEAFALTRFIGWFRRRDIYGDIHEYEKVSVLGIPTTLFVFSRERTQQGLQIHAQNTSMQSTPQFPSILCHDVPRVEGSLVVGCHEELMDGSSFRGPPAMLLPRSHPINIPCAIVGVQKVSLGQFELSIAPNVGTAGRPRKPAVSTLAIHFILKVDLREDRSARLIIVKRCWAWCVYHPFNIGSPIARSMDQLHRCRRNEQEMLAAVLPEMWSVSNVEEEQEVRSCVFTNGHEFQG